jgi:type I restriction enzyme S subunit
MSSLVPVGWAELRLGEISSLITKGTTPKKYSNEGVNFVKVESVSKTASLLPSKFAYIDIATHEELKRSQLQNGDILFSIAGSLGRLAVVNSQHLPANTNQALAIIRLQKDSIDVGFCVQQLKSDVTQFELKNLQTVGAQPNLSLQQVSDISLKTPPLPEQQKIAQILTSVDEVIEKTQAQIDKLKDLKTAMMQELLTKGIGHLEFKDSPVGRIPVGWEVKTLEALSSFVTSGSRGWAQYYSSTGAIFIRIGNLTREHINFRFKDIIYVTPPNSAEGKRTLVQEGDVLISITADLGIIAVVNESIGEAYVNQHVSLVRLDDPSMARWVGHFLAFEDSRKQFTANNDAGAKAGLNLTAIRKTQVALPSKNERRKIVEALDSVDKLISEKRRKLNVTNDTKKALMQDLLTGKVRVS